MIGGNIRTSESKRVRRLPARPTLGLPPRWGCAAAAETGRSATKRSCKGSGFRVEVRKFRVEGFRVVRKFRV